MAGSVSVTVVDEQWQVLCCQPPSAVWVGDPGPGSTAACGSGVSCPGTPPGHPSPGKRGLQVLQWGQLSPSLPDTSLSQALASQTLRNRREVPSARPARPIPGCHRGARRLPARMTLQASDVSFPVRATGRVEAGAVLGGPGGPPARCSCPSCCACDPAPALCPAHGLWEPEWG